MAEFQNSEAELPRVLFEYEVHLDRVLDFLDGETRTARNTSRAKLIGTDQRHTWNLGVDAYNDGYQAIRSWSATGVGNVLAVFLGTVIPGDHLEGQHRETWEDHPTP